MHSFQIIIKKACTNQLFFKKNMLLSKLVFYRKQELDNYNIHRRR